MTDPNAPCKWFCCRKYHRLLFYLIERKMAGSKSYIVAALMAAYAIGGYALGLHGADVMMQVLLAAAATAGLRHGITTEASK